MRQWSTHTANASVLRQHLDSAVHQVDRRPALECLLRNGRGRTAAAVSEHVAGMEESGRTGALALFFKGEPHAVGHWSERLRHWTE